MEARMVSGSRSEPVSQSLRGMTWSLKSLVIFVFLLLAPFLSMPEPFTTSTYHADAGFESDEAWRTVSLWARYSEGRAVFTQKPEATIHVDLAAERTIQSIQMRLHNYRGDGLNQLALHLGSQTEFYSYGGPELQGTAVHEVKFDPPIPSTSVALTTLNIGDEAVLIDGLRVIDAGRSFDLRRYALHFVIWALVLTSLGLAVQFAQGPVVSSGRVYASVDMLRGVGAFLVIALHATGYAGGLDLSGIPFVAQVARQGHYGVEIFYVVSAFTLTFSLTAMLKSKRVRDLIQGFWLRRILRIAPLFGTVFVICVVSGAIFALPSNLMSQDTLSEVIWKYVTMTYVFERQILVAPILHSVWWSISTEFQFYILMPLSVAPMLAFLMKYKGAQTRSVSVFLATGLAFAGVFLAAGARHALLEQPWSVYTAVYHLDAFLVGVAVALPFAFSPQRLPVSDAQRHTGVVFGWASLAFVTLIALMLGVAFSKHIGAMLALPKLFLPSRLTVIFLCAFAIVVLRLAENNGAFQHMKLSMLRAVGLLSFGIYVVHVPVMQLVGSLPVPPSLGGFEDLYVWMLGLSFAASLVIALVLHRLVEMPVLALSRIPRLTPILSKFSAVYVGVVTLSFIWVLLEIS